MAGLFRRRSLLPALLAACLAGCNPEWMRSYERTTAATTTPPASYRADITAFMRTYLNDPSRIRDAAVSEPELKTFDGVSRYVVCVRYNARRGSGQYAGEVREDAPKSAARSALKTPPTRDDAPRDDAPHDDSWIGRFWATIGDGFVALVAMLRQLFA